MSLVFFMSLFKMSHLIPSDFCLISKKLDALCDAGGFESHPFKIGWYNDAVGEKFR